MKVSFVATRTARESIWSSVVVGSGGVDVGTPRCQKKITEMSEVQTPKPWFKAGLKVLILNRLEGTVLYVR